MQKVTCSECGKEMDCPENMLSAETHICADCTDEMTGDDNPLEAFGEFAETMKYVDGIVNELTELKLAGIWKEDKEELKNMTRKELAREMLREGIGEAFMLLATTGFPKEEFARLRELSIVMRDEDEEKLKALFAKWQKEEESKLQK